VNRALYHCGRYGRSRNRRVNSRTTRRAFVVIKSRTEFTGDDDPPSESSGFYYYFRRNGNEGGKRNEREMCFDVVGISPARRETGEGNIYIL